MFSNTIEDHYSHLKWILGTLKRVGLKLNISKCEFAVKKINFVGFDVSNNKISMTDEQVKKACDFKIPTTRAEL